MAEISLISDELVAFHEIFFYMGLFNDLLLAFYILNRID
jgi:hypothetical protein